MSPSSACGFAAASPAALRARAARGALSRARPRAAAAAPRRACVVAAQQPGEPAEPVPGEEASMPALYDAWFPPGFELAHQMREAVGKALDDGKYRMEIKWPCVPNLEEINGTKNNFEFGKHVSRTLGMDSPADYPLIKRYLGEFSDLYWVVQLSKMFPERTVWAVFSDSIGKSRAESCLGNVKLASLRKGAEPDTKDGDVVVIVDPRLTDAWFAGSKLQASPTSPLIFMNSQFNETYGLTGPRRRALSDVETVYFLKRITRGYVYRSYPGKWQAVLERPDCSCEVLETYDDVPKLRTAAGIVRETSNNRYGVMNDRYSKGFGGRL